jgi:subtilisin family serine protease
MRALATLSIPSLMFAIWTTSAHAQDATAQSTAKPARIANQYICMFNESVSKAAVRTEANKAVGPELGRILHIYENSVKGFAVRLPASPQGAAAAMQRLLGHNPKISQCVEDGMTRAAVQGRRPGGGGGSSGQNVPWGVNRVGGAGDGTALAGKRAWVIDSGIDLDHPDLNVDTSADHDVIDGDDVAEDGYGHGTHVAGIIGAKNNSIGVVGVAAGVPLVPVRVLNNLGVGPDSGVIAGIDYAAGLALAGDVINLSLVADAPDPVMDEAVRAAAAKGIFVTIAAGNSGANAGNYSPGRTEGANIFTVSAFGSRDTWARFSNHGNPPIDYSEPGVDIPSTNRGDGYATRSGTSMAAPHLAGILLLSSAGPSAGGNVRRDPDGNPDVIGVR